MASLIQQTVPLLDSMSNLELQCIEQLARAKIDPMKPSRSGFSSLPRELRDKIYYYTGANHLLHLQDGGNLSRRRNPFHPLLLVNKQTRQEFKKFFYSRHMILAAYFDDTVKDCEKLRRVPTWLLQELLTSREPYDDCQLEWQSDKCGRGWAEMLIESSQKKDRREDPDIPRAPSLRGHRWTPCEEKEVERYRLARQNAETSRFYGFVEIVGQEDLTIALIEFEKFLLSEDRWFKVDGFDKEDGVFARNARYRKNSVTVEQRLEAAKKQDKPMKRAKTVKLPLVVADERVETEDRALE